MYKASEQTTRKPSKSEAEAEALGYHEKISTKKENEEQSKTKPTTSSHPDAKLNGPITRSRKNAGSSHQFKSQNGSSAQSKRARFENIDTVGTKTEKMELRKRKETKSSSGDSQPSTSGKSRAPPRGSKRTREISGMIADDEIDSESVSSRTRNRKRSQILSGSSDDLDRRLDNSTKKTRNSSRKEVATSQEVAGAKSNQSSSGNSDDELFTNFGDSPIRRRIVRKRVAPTTRISTNGFLDENEEVDDESDNEGFLTSSICRKLRKLCEAIISKTGDEKEAVEHLNTFKLNLDESQLLKTASDFLQIKIDELLEAEKYDILDEYVALRRKMMNDVSIQVIVTYMQSYSNTPNLEILERMLFNAAVFPDFVKNDRPTTLSEQWTWMGFENLKRFSELGQALKVPSFSARSKTRSPVLPNRIINDFTDLRWHLCSTRKDGGNDRQGYANAKTFRCYDLLMKETSHLTENQIVQISFGFMKTRIDELYDNGVNTKEHSTMLKNYLTMMNKKQEFALYASLVYIASYYHDEEDFETFEKIYFEKLLPQFRINKR